jgi:hypothetical protein
MINPFSEVSFAPANVFDLPSKSSNGISSQKRWM